MGEKVPNDKGLLLGFLWDLWYYLKTHIHAFVAIGRQNVSPKRKLNEIPVRSGEVAIVTGGARGIGAEVVQQFLEADMTVIIACRDTSAGYKMVKEFRHKTGITKGTAQCLELDLNSLDTVRQFVKNFRKMDLPLHILVNNAAVWCPFKRTVDGFESQFQVNYLGHFLLTVLLIPCLTKGGSQARSSRIVNVSSIVGLIGKIDVDNILTCKFFSKYQNYCDTKLMQLVISNYMNKSFLTEKLPIRSYAVHPGVVDTELFKDFPFRPLVNLLTRFLGKTPREGSYPIVWTAFAEDLDNHGGKFVDNCTFIPHPHPQAEDPSIQGKLWEVSCAACKIKTFDSTTNSNSNSTTPDPDPFVIVNID